MIVMKKLEKNGVKITEKTEEIFKAAKLLPHLKGIADCDGNWSKAIIEKRSENLLNIIWNRLIKKLTD